MLSNTFSKERDYWPDVMKISKTTKVLKYNKSNLIYQVVYNITQELAQVYYTYYQFVRSESEIGKYQYNSIPT